MEKVKCKFCGKEFPSKERLHSHYGACQEYRRFRKFMERLEKLFEEVWTEKGMGEFLGASEHEKIIDLIADINKQLAEIRVLLRRMCEHLELSC